MWTPRENRPFNPLSWPVCLSSTFRTFSSVPREKILERNWSSKNQMEGSIVNQLRKERFPVEMRISWNKIWPNPLIIPANRRGISVKRGRINSTTWLPNVSNWCHHSGAFDKEILKNFIHHSCNFKFHFLRHKKHICHSQVTTILLLDAVKLPKRFHLHAGKIGFYEWHKMKI